MKQRTQQDIGPGGGKSEEPSKVPGLAAEVAQAVPTEMGDWRR